MRIQLLILFLFATTTAYCQTQESPKLYSVRADNPKNDDQFSKQLSFILESYGNDYERVPKEFTMKDVMDSSFTLKEKLPGANEATITKNKESITWTERFPFGQDVMGMFKLLQKVKAALPDDFVYTKNYDAASRISDYTFFKKADSKIVHPGYPEEIHLNGDAVSAYLTVVKYK